MQTYRIMYIIILVVINFLFIKMSYEDIKNMEIKSNNIASLIILDILFNKNSLFTLYCLKYILVIIIVISITVIFPSINKYMGGADIKLFLLLIPLIGKKIISLILLSSLLGLMYSIINKKRVIPFIPFISIALLILEVKYLIK